MADLAFSDKVIDLFGVRRIQFEPHQDAHARECKSRQSWYWKALSSSITDLLSAVHSDASFNESMSIYLDFLINNAENRTKIHRVDGRSYVVESDIPLLNSGGDFPDMVATDVFFVISAIIVETMPKMLSGSLGNININFKNLLGGPISIIINEYSSKRAFRTTTARAKIDRYESSIADLTLKLEDSRSTIIRDIEESVNKHATLIAEFDERSSAAISDFDDSAKRKIDAYLAAQSEFQRIKRPVDLWSSNASRHRRSFWLGLLALLALIVGATFAALTSLPHMITTLGISNTDASGHFTPATTLVLATIIALLAAAGFVVKIMGRFVTNALTLAEDAEVRAALADTFIGLTAEDSTLDEKARDQARTVMLAALFRPLPGHQQEEITAPTVLSLAQDMLGKKSDKD